jgi:four helix bundle protein
MEFKFEKLIIWQKAMDFVESIFLISCKFPKEEIYNLSSQIRRAVDPIALNISEGFPSGFRLRTSD